MNISPANDRMQVLTPFVVALVLAITMEVGAAMIGVSFSSHGTAAPLTPPPSAPTLVAAPDDHFDVDAPFEPAPVTKKISLQARPPQHASTRSGGCGSASLPCVEQTHAFGFGFSRISTRAGWFQNLFSSGTWHADGRPVRRYKLKSFSGDNAHRVRAA